jgi:hypothetical protein
MYIPSWEVETQKGWVTVQAFNQDTARALVENAGYTVYYIQMAEDSGCST